MAKRSGSKDSKRRGRPPLMQDRTRITLDLPRELLEAVRALAESEGVTLAALLRRLIEKGAKRAGRG